MTHSTRRDFLQLSTLAAASSLMPSWNGLTRTMAQEAKSPNERPKVGCIGNSGMGTGDASAIKNYGDIVALCDVDSNRSGVLNEKLLGGGAKRGTGPIVFGTTDAVGWLVAPEYGSLRRRAVVRRVARCC